jgi:transposase
MQRQKLAKLLLQGAQAHGYADQFWTLKRIARVIEEHFQITYHPSHVWKILQAMDWSCQKPERLAREQDRKAVESWRKQTWPHIKKRSSQ